MDGSPRWESARHVWRVLLDPYLQPEDRDRLRVVLTSEADWLLGEYDVVGDPWGSCGKNRPELNMWNGAILWRAAASYPEEPLAPAWREKAHRFLMNAISVPADASDERMVAGRPVREWHVGANFFPHYALDHHGYTNVGYSVITLSNAAMLHYDLQALGALAPESLYHHNADLWAALRPTVFSDGRLARIGGDSRVRYTYCQEYLLPALIYAADYLGDADAVPLVEGMLNLIEREWAYSGDGSFYGRRLQPLAASNPYYHSRLESDRAAVLAMAATYLVQSAERDGAGAAEATLEPTAVSFERSAQGVWCEPDYGAVLHRSPTRLASFAWRAHGLTQGLCQPPDDGHLADWQQNLSGVVRFLGDDGVIKGGQTTHRRLERQHTAPFDGGFLTYGAVTEGLDLAFDEGWRGEQPALHRIAYAALPDGHTVLCLEHCCTGANRSFLVELKGMHLLLPNDLYNGHRREIACATGSVPLSGPPSGRRSWGWEVPGRTWMGAWGWWACMAARRWPFTARPGDAAASTRPCTWKRYVGHAPTRPVPTRRIPSQRCWTWGGRRCRPSRRRRRPGSPQARRVERRCRGAGRALRAGARTRRTRLPSRGQLG
jgi:hypothetical protein